MFSSLLALKTITENIAISIQIFEWVCLFNLINFQRKIPHNQLEPKLGKFKPREKRLSIVFQVLLVLSILLGVAMNVCFIVWPGYFQNLQLLL